MAKVLDDTAKKTLMVAKTPTGKYKILGLYKKTTTDGEVFLLPMENGVFGSIAIEFDEVEFTDTLYHARGRDAKRSADSIHYLEYGKS